jgi:hypothetical protein
MVDMQTINIVFFILNFCLFSLGSAFATEDTTHQVILELCTNGLAEGTYSAKIGAAGQFKIYLICTGTGEMVATMRDGISTGGTASNQLTMANNAIDDDILSFVSFGTSARDAKSETANGIDGRLQVSIIALRRGELKGTVRFLRMLSPVAISVSRESAFPNVLMQAGHGTGVQRATGTFKTLDVPGSSAKLVPNNISLDVIGGIQRATLNFSDPNVGNAFALYNGLKADSDQSGVFYVTSGVDYGNGPQATTQHIRGRFLNFNEIEFYYISTQVGLVGPIHARRR